MAAFAVCLGLAIYWRKKPEMHRRMMLIATCGLLDAAFGRVDYVFNNSLYFLCLDPVILLGVLRDLFVIRRVHKVYLIALPLLMVCQGFVVYTLRSSSHWWIRIADRILG